ncbi:L51-S25-CI-B8 domain-containing protein [Mycena indigotica]|uniref:Large ribosomal subunit protein mL43 n=1 Tax=Mycena indigotica TaxID=2126181 RepID=A0A8H6SLG5_9AGAR|nr:L51-S25-CI-B8 domain-containing protein [Mycena indigotica]KAF7301940.1 L51-S25-CI-B8 domain-containing protein [Mycena indigotica]
MDEAKENLGHVTVTVTPLVTHFFCCMNPIPLLRAQTNSLPANGHGAFVPQIRKLVFEYCNDWPSSAPTRTFLSRNLVAFAREHPHVEIVVKQRNRKEPIVRGFYANGRDKVIALNKLQVTGIEQKLQLLLDSSGMKIKPLKRRTVESTTEAARGIWSGLHAARPTL